MPLRAVVDDVPERTVARRTEQRMSLKSYQSSWKRKPSWAKLHLAADETVELLVVSAPWTFERPAAPGRKPFVRHVLNVVPRSSLNNPAEKVALVWEISDALFHRITFDPTRFWLRVTRRGQGKRNTQYVIEAGEEATDTEQKLASAKHQYNLELVARETRARTRP